MRGFRWSQRRQLFLLAGGITGRATPVEVVGSSSLCRRCQHIPCFARFLSAFAGHTRLPHVMSSSSPASGWSGPGGQKRSMFIQTQSTPNPLSLMFYPGKPVMEVGSADFPNARSAMTSPLAKALYRQKRSMFIQTQSTPNPLSLMFYPGKPVMEVGSADFPNARSAMTSPLAKALYSIDGTTRVFLGSDFITVTKSEDASWDFLKPEIFAAIMDFYTSGKPLFLDSNAAASMDTAIHEDDSEIVAMIKELLETRIRPSVQDDGGDIEYRGYDPETGIVKLRMQGACSGCPSSSVTLKSGIENMLMHYIPEVRGVEQELDSEEDAAPMSQVEQ